MMSDWFVRVVRYDGSKGNEEKFTNYVDAKQAYDKFEKLVDGTRDIAGGRIRLQSSNGTTMAMAFVA